MSVSPNLPSMREWRAVRFQRPCTTKGSRTVCWVESEIDAYIADLIKARDRCLGVRQLMHSRLLSHNNQSWAEK